MAEVPLRIPVVAEDAGALEALRDIRDAIGTLRESMLQQAATQRKVTEEQKKAAEEARKAAAEEKKLAAEQKVAAKAQLDAIKQVEKAYKSALAPHEKTKELLEEITALRFEDEESITKQAVAIAHLNAKYEDQYRRFEMNRGSQNKLSRSLAELLDEQTKAQTAAIAAGAALIKEGISSDHLSSALLHLSATTADADKKTEAYRVEVDKLEQQLREVTAAEKANAAAQKAAAEHYDVTKKKLDAVETAMEGLRIPGAEIVTSLKRMSDSMETANRVLTPAQVRWLKAGIAIGGAGLAAAGAVAGIAAVTGAVLANSAAADDWNHDLKKLGLSLDAVGTNRVNRAAASIDAMGNVARALGVAIADSVSPEVTELGTRLVALGLSSIDGFNNMAKGEGVMLRLAEIASGVLTEAITSPLTLLSLMPRIFGMASDALGITETAAADVAGVLESVQKKVQDKITPAIIALAKDGMEVLIAETDDYMVKAAALVTRQTAVNESMRKGKEDVQAYAQSLIDMNLSLESGPNPYQIRVERAKEAADQEMDLDRQIAEFRAEQREAEAAAEQAMAEARIENIQRGLTLAQQAAGAAVALATLVAGENSKAAKIAFYAQQAAALAGVAVNTALGVTSALAAPPPATMAQKAINAGIVIATGLASAATIASTTIKASKAPQTRHAGGAVIDTTGWEPGEVPVKARAGEVVVSAEQARALGGPTRATQAVRAMAAGGGAQASYIVYDRLTIARAVEDDWLANGRTRRIMQEGQRYGLRPSGR